MTNLHESQTHTNQHESMTGGHESRILYKDLSYKLQGCFYNVRNRYGRGHKENIYQKALAEELELAGIKFVPQPRIDVYSLLTGKKIGTYVPDFLIDNCIIVEIKASPFTIKDMSMQTCEYIKTTIFEIGYLVNFGEEDFKPKRFIYTNNRKPFSIKKDS